MDGSERKARYVATKRGIAFQSERDPGHVQVPHYVIDLWTPLLGVPVLGLYLVYCRLERREVIKGMSLDSLALDLRISKPTLIKYNALLEECGFLEIVRPAPAERLMHHCLTIRVLNPPREVTAEQMATLRPHAAFRPLASWMDESKQASLVKNKTADGKNQSPPAVKNKTATPHVDSRTTCNHPPTPLQGDAHEPGPGKVPDPPHPDTHSVYQQYLVLRELTYDLKAPENKGATKAMLKAGYSPDEILACLRHLMADPWYRDRCVEVTLGVVKRKIAAWKAMTGGSNGRPAPPDETAQRGPVRFHKYDG